MSSVDFGARAENAGTVPAFFVIADNNVNSFNNHTPTPAGVCSLVAKPPSGVGFLDVVDIIDGVDRPPRPCVHVTSPPKKHLPLNHHHHTLERLLANPTEPLQPPNIVIIYADDLGSTHGNAG